MNTADREQVRNETIDELADWLDACITQVDPNSDVHKACSAMVRGMRGKKTNPLDVARQAAEGTHYPLSSNHGVDFSR